VLVRVVSLLAQIKLFSVSTAQRDSVFISTVTFSSVFSGDFICLSSEGLVCSSGKTPTLNLPLIWLQAVNR